MTAHALPIGTGPILDARLSSPACFGRLMHTLLLRFWLNSLALANGSTPNLGSCSTAWKRDPLFVARIAQFGISDLIRNSRMVDRRHQLTQSSRAPYAAQDGPCHPDQMSASAFAFVSTASKWQFPAPRCMWRLYRKGDALHVLEYNSSLTLHDYSRLVQYLYRLEPDPAWLRRSRGQNPISCAQSLGPLSRSTISQRNVAGEPKVIENDIVFEPKVS